MVRPFPPRRASDGRDRSSIQRHRLLVHDISTLVGYGGALAKAICLVSGTLWASIPDLEGMENERRPIDEVGVVVGLRDFGSVDARDYDRYSLRLRKWTLHWNRAFRVHRLVESASLFAP